MPRLTEPKTYRLGSSKLINAPGVIRWAVNGYKFDDAKENLVEMVQNGWHIPEKAAEALLSGEAKYHVEDDVVVFEA